MNRIGLFRTLIISLIICLLTWDVFAMIGRANYSLPETHKQVLLTGALLWFVAVISDRNGDDDWAGAL